MNEDIKAFFIAVLLAFVIGFMFIGKANADIHQFYFIPAEAIQSEQIMFDVLTAIHVDFKTQCPGEADMQVTVLRTGVAIEMFCIAMEVNNESNNLPKVQQTSWLSKTEPPSENISISYL